MGANINTIGKIKAYDFSLLVDRLYEFHFKNYGGQIIVYLLSLIMVLSYMILSGIILSRPEQNTIIEGLILGAVFLLGLPLLYVLKEINLEKKLTTETQKIANQQVEIAKAIAKKIPRAEDNLRDMVKAIKEYVDKSVKIDVKEEREKIKFIIFLTSTPDVCSEIVFDKKQEALMPGSFSKGMHINSIFEAGLLLGQDTLPQNWSGWYAAQKKLGIAEKSQLIIPVIYRKGLMEAGIINLLVFMIVFEQVREEILEQVTDQFLPLRPNQSASLRRD